METEEQLVYDSRGILYAGQYYRQGQKLTIPNRTIARIGFWLDKVGSPTGNILYALRKVSDDSLIYSQVLCDAAALETEATYEELVLDTPQLINEEVRMYVEFNGGGSSDNVGAYFNNSDTKASEIKSAYKTSWADIASQDIAYIYTYGEEAAGGDGGQASLLVAQGLI